MPWKENMIADLEKTSSEFLLTSQVLVGVEVAKIPDNKLVQYANKVSRELTTHPYTMLQFSPSSLLENIKKGQAIMMVGGAEMDLFAFAQIWYYGANNRGHPIYEFGSWLSFAKGGHGTEVLLKAPTLAKSLDINSQVVAIVEKDNARTLGIIEALGGRNIGLKESPVIKDPLGNFATMKVFDIAYLDSKDALARGLACEKGIPLRAIPKWVDCLRVSLGEVNTDPEQRITDPTQRVIDYLNMKIRMDRVKDM